jgi:hypothetical protein
VDARHDVRATRLACPSRSTELVPDLAAGGRVDGAVRRELSAGTSREPKSDLRGCDRLERRDGSWVRLAAFLAHASIGPVGEVCRSLVLGQVPGGHDAGVVEPASKFRE